MVSSSGGERWFVTLLPGTLASLELIDVRRISQVGLLTTAFKFENSGFIQLQKAQKRIQDRLNMFHKQCSG